MPGLFMTFFRYAAEWTVMLPSDLDLIQMILNAGPFSGKQLQGGQGDLPGAGASSDGGDIHRCFLPLWSFPNQESGKLTRFKRVVNI